MAGCPRERDGGASILEYAAVLAVAAVVAGVLIAAAPGIGSALSSHVSAAVCAALGGEQCGGEGEETAAQEPAESGDDSGSGEVATYAAQQDQGLTSQDLHEQGDATLEALQSSPTGRAALEYLEDLGVYGFPVYFGDDPARAGYLCAGTGGHLYINVDRDPLAAAATLVHEVTHYEDLVEEEIPVPADYEDTAAGQQQYFEDMAATEARAVLNQMDYLREMDVQGHRTGGHLDILTILEAGYRAAWSEAMDNPATRATAHSIARRVTHERLVDFYLTGTDDASQTYREIWQSNWETRAGLDGFGDCADPPEGSVPWQPE